MDRKTLAIKTQTLVRLIGAEREPYIETGRKFDKIMVNGKAHYFVAKIDDAGRDVRAGDIYGAKSELAPNFRWYFGNIANVERWDWSGQHGRPVSDDTVIEAKRYGSYVHYKRVPEKN